MFERLAAGRQFTSANVIVSGQLGHNPKYGLTEAAPGPQTREQFKAVPARTAAVAEGDFE